MKKLVSIAMMIAALFAAQAQLGAPKVTVRDTLYIVSCMYNGSELSPVDWPDTVIVEDAINITIAGYSYRKGAPTYSDVHAPRFFWKGHISFYKYSATCNGKTEDIYKTVTEKDCRLLYNDAVPYYGKYDISGYEFYVLNKENMLRYRNSLRY